MRYLGMRTLTQFLHGHHPGPDGAIFKLYWSEYHKVVTELAVDILGADAMVPTGPAAVDGVPDRRCRRAEQLVRAGWARSSTPGPAPSTPARRRSSATSSARWCSGCPKEPKATAARAEGERRVEATGSVEAWGGAALCVARRAAAGLWPTASRQCRAALPRRWWRRRPFLPVPPGEYVRFRLITQYGSADHHIEPADVLNYLSWCKLHRAVAT